MMPVLVMTKQAVLFDKVMGVSLRWRVRSVAVVVDVVVVVVVVDEKKGKEMKNKSWVYHDASLLDLF
jgi:hypothetical protein